MSWLMAAVYDRFMRVSKEACLAMWRASAAARPLRARCSKSEPAPAPTLPHYPKTVTRLVLCEPDPHMRPSFEAKRDAAGRACRDFRRFARGPAAARPRSTRWSARWCFCSVPDQKAALTEIPARAQARRQAGVPRARRRRRQAEPPEMAAPHRAGLEAPDGQLPPHAAHRGRITAAGFNIERIERESIRKALPIVRPSSAGRTKRPLSLVEEDGVLKPTSPSARAPSGRTRRSAACR